MPKHAFLNPALHIAIALALTGCAAHEDRTIEPTAPPALASEIRETVHRDGDDLLSAGLGLARLRAPAPPLADDTLDRSQHLRRVAIHANWRGLADLTASGGYGEGAELAVVEGREFHAFARLPGRAQPFRVMVQLPDAFDPDRPCLVVAPASGSRGIYGGLPVAGPWALPRGCALALTDKGAGTDLFDHAGDTGTTLDGTRAARGTALLGFEPAPIELGPRSAGLAMVSIPHAHSGDNPEADWGRHTLEAARFGLAVLDRAYPDRAPFTPERVRITGVAISNGGNAVLRALEIDQENLFDAAVVGAPNITAPGERPLYDYATEAALFQPCTLADPQGLMALPFGNPMLLPAAQARCNSLHRAGLITEPTAAAARSVLEASGFEAGALEQAAVNTALDLWRAVAALYASAYLQSPVDAMPCGYAVAALDAAGKPAPAPSAQVELWWATSSGVVPSGAAGWIDSRAAESPEDPAFAGLLCLRQLWTGKDADAQKLRQSVANTLATARLPNIPVVILHGRQDGLIPPAFSARPYAQAAQAKGAEQLEYREFDGAQHFDSLVPFPGMSSRYQPLIPMVWEALDELE
jgi:hydroxybutyrate-dimer hydrolase